MSKKSKSYFLSAFLTILFAVIVFWGLRKILPARLFPENTVTSSNVVIDSLALDALNNKNSDTITIIPLDTVSRVDTTLANIHLTATEHTEGYDNLITFYQKLEKLESTKKGKIRVAYFGDSMIDGDLIVQDIRCSFQDTFGGEGIGFVGITSQSAASRYSVSHQYSKNWKTQSCLNVKSPKYPFGVDGQVAFAPDPTELSWVRYRANNLAHATTLKNPTLFYGQGENETAYVSIIADKDTAIQKVLKPTNLLNTLPLTSNAKSLKVDFNKTAGIPFYGINIDDSVGVYVDNFSIRGNSGLPLSGFNSDLMKAFDKVLHYDLIILQYGTNVLNYSSSNYDWYENKMTNVVNHIKNCFPNAEVLIISVGDRATKQNMEMKTDKSVAPLLKAQKEYASTTHSSFINLFSLMGGQNSMVKWVGESMANKDYTHFSAKGSKKIGQLIFNEINNGYIDFKQQNKSGVKSL